MFKIVFPKTDCDICTYNQLPRKIVEHTCTSNSIGKLGNQQSSI